MRNILVDKKNSVVMLTKDVGTGAYLLSWEENSYSFNENHFTEGISIFDDDKPINRSLYERHSS